MHSGGEEEEEQSAAGTSQNVGRIEGAVQTALIHQAPSQGVSRTRPQVGGNCAQYSISWAQHSISINKSWTIDLSPIQTKSVSQNKFVHQMAPHFSCSTTLAPCIVV